MKAETISQKKELAVQAAEILYHYKLIANSVGITDETMKAWRDADEDFSHRLEQGRTRFIEKHMKKARPEFLLERTARDLFAPPAQQVDMNTENPVKVLLQAYGINSSEGNDEPKTDESVQGPSQSPA